MNEETKLEQKPIFSLSDQPSYSKAAVFPINSPKDMSLNSSRPKLEDEKICRICLEFETTDDKLIWPCRCAGSVKFVHEECLKT